MGIDAKEIFGLPVVFDDRVPVDMFGLVHPPRMLYPQEIRKLQLTGKFEDPFVFEQVFGILIEVIVANPEKVLKRSKLSTLYVFRGFTYYQLGAHEEVIDDSTVTCNSRA